MFQSHKLISLNKQYSIEQARGQSHEEDLDLVFILDDLKFGDLRLSRLWYGK